MAKSVELNLRLQKAATTEIIKTFNKVVVESYFGKLIKFKKKKKIRTATTKKKFAEFFI